MPGLTVKNLSKAFVTTRGARVMAVRELSFTVAPRELFVLVGPSGSGKTTALRLIAGLESPDAGSIELEDRKLDNVPAKDRDVAMVFQSASLFPHLTVFENLAFGLRLRKIPRAQITAQINAAAEQLDLSALLDRKPQGLSGGEAQRVALARALLRRPKIFLFDEPLSNLDAPARLRWRREIKKLRDTTATPLIYVTHDQFEAMILADRLAVLHDGAIEQVGSPAELLQSPANSYVEDFFAPAREWIEQFRNAGTPWDPLRKR
jgi:ABC-type sugar transport system ATPase subunit